MFILMLMCFEGCMTDGASCQMYQVNIHLLANLLDAPSLLVVQSITVRIYTPVK